MPGAVSRVAAGLLLVLAGCDSTPEPPDSGQDSDPVTARAPLDAVTLSLLPAGQANLLVPIQVGLNATTRRAFVSSNGLPTLAEVDLDAGALVAVHELGDIPALHALVAPADDGSVWLGFDSAPGLQRFVPGVGLEDPRAPLEACHALVALPGGGVAAAGRTEAGSDDLLLLVSPDGTTVTVPWTGAVMSMALTSAGLAVLQSEGTEVRAVVTLDPATGEELGRCGAPDSGIGGGFAWMAPLEDGGFAFATSTVVSRVSCPSGEWATLTAGRENRSVLPLPDSQFLVLDRLGGTDRNWGLASRYEADLTPTRDAFETGKNSGYGALDPVTGLAWMNSEGTGELWGMDPLTGEVSARVPLGAHVESLVVDPGNPDRVVYSGRLSTEIGVADLRGASLVRVDTDRRWPVSPVFLGERCFYLDDLTGDIVEVDRESLAEKAVLPSALGTNSFLTLSDLLAHPERGTLFVSGPQSNEVAEVDPDSGAVVGRWTLGGVAPRDPDLPGKLELALAGSFVVVVRNNDGLLTRIDPDAATHVGEGEAHPAAVKLTVRSHQMDATEVSEDGKYVWLTSVRMNADSFDADEPLDDVERMLVDETSGARLTWGAGTITWWVGGNAVADAPAAGSEWGAPAFAVGGEADTVGVAMGSFDTAQLSWVPLPHP